MLGWWFFFVEHGGYHFVIFKLPLLHLQGQFRSNCYFFEGNWSFFSGCFCLFIFGALKLHCDIFRYKFLLTYPAWDLLVFYFLLFHISVTFWIISSYLFSNSQILSLALSKFPFNPFTEFFILLVFCCLISEVFFGSSCLLDHYLYFPVLWR